MRISLEQKKKYLDRRLIEIEEIKRSLSNDNFDLAISVGHKIKGSGETFGFPEISVIGGLIESAGIKNDKVIIITELENLSKFVILNLEQIFEN